MKKSKKVSCLISICLILLVILGNFSLPVLAYEKKSVNFGQVRTETKINNGEADFSKINSSSKEVKNSFPNSSITTKEKAGLEKFQQLEVTKKDYVEGEILIKYKEGKINLNTSSGRKAALKFIDSKSLERKEDLKGSNISVLKIKDRKTVEEKIAELKNDQHIEYAEPNYKRYPATINTNDTNRGLLWGLDNTGQSVDGFSGTNDADIDAPEAWAINEGTNAPVIVAIIDSGVAYNHPDLLANMWNGTSCKDENGDALGSCNYGYDYEDDDKTPLPSNSSHGTHIAGIIAAKKNNSKGIIGVAPNAKIMAIKYGFDIASEIKSIDFAIQNGAKIINASFAGTFFSQSEYDAINRFKTAGGIFVTAAGNDSTNNESIHKYPSDYNLDNIISVAATDQNDNLATFSNYGAISVDIGAPGTNIYSTVIDENGTEVLFEDFEAVIPPALPTGWVTGGADNNWGTWDLDGAWGNVLYGDLAYPYVDNANTTITSPAYDLNTSNATMDFWAKCDTEYITDGWADYMQLEYSSDGVNFFPAIDPYFGGDFKWDEPTLDVLNGEDPLDSANGALFHYSDIPIPTQYSTSTFKFRFRWVTNASDNNYDGCLVDDVTITKYSDGSDEAYDYSDGTSTAAPYVAGLAALVEGSNPDLTYSQVKNIILTTGDDISSLHGKTSAGTRINAHNAIAEALGVVESSPVFRFWSNVKQGHFFTISVAEKDSIIANDPSWTYEGVAYNSFTSQESNTTPVYRFWSNSKQHHFFTVSEAEKDSIIANDPSWAYEGIAYYAYATQQPNTTPVYRFWSQQKQGHFFTTSVAEKNSIIATDPSWAYEGIAWYVPTN